MKNRDEAFLDFLNGVKSLIIKIATVYCPEESERKDLIQDIILQMWRSFGNYNPDYAATTWTYRVALNVSISWVRKESFRRKQRLQYEREFVDWNDQASEDARIKPLLKFIETLNPVDKAIMTLLLEGKRNKEIAEILGITASNVSTRINRVKAMVKKHFKH